MTDAIHDISSCIASVIIRDCVLGTSYFGLRYFMPPYSVLSPNRYYSPNVSRLKPSSNPYGESQFYRRTFLSTLDFSGIIAEWKRESWQVPFLFSAVFCRVFSLVLPFVLRFFLLFLSFVPLGRKRVLVKIRLVLLQQTAV